MKSLSGHLLIMVLSATSCLSVARTERNSDLVENARETFVASEMDARAHKIVSQSAAGITLQIEVLPRHCKRERVETVRRITTIENTVNGTHVAIAAALSGAALAAGIVTIMDAPNVPQADDPRTKNPVSRERAYETGIGLTVLGGVGAGATILALLDSRDETKAPGSFERKSTEIVEAHRCGASYAAGESVWIDNEKGKPFQLGTTDNRGAVSIAWQTIPESMLAPGTPAAMRKELKVRRLGTEVLVPSSGPPLDLEKAATDFAHRRDLVQWEKAEPERCKRPMGPRDCDGIKAYLRVSPKGSFADEARGIIDSSAARMEEIQEGADWTNADQESCKRPASATDCDGIDRYLTAHPNGAHAAAAKKMLAASEARIAALQRRAEARASLQSSADELCHVLEQLSQLEDAVKIQMEIDIRSGTQNLLANRNMIAARIHLVRKRSDLLKEFSSAGVKFNRKDDCAESNEAGQ